MEIPLIARITEFATTSSSNIIHHRFLTFFEFPSHHRFWKWGALLLAFIYAFNRMIKNFRSITVRLSSSSAPLLVGDDEFFTSDDEDEVSVSSSCSSEDEKEMRDDPTSISYENLSAFYEDYRVKGSPVSNDRKRKFKIRRKRSLTGCNMFKFGDLVNGNGVVKLWDELGLGLDCSSSVSILDLERKAKIGSFPGENSAVSASSAVLFTAGAGVDGKVGLSSWDVRVRRRTPAAKAEWSLKAAEPVVRLKAGGGAEKVYVRDGVTGEGKVWDVRNAKTPLKNVTEYERETWWDAHAVSQNDEE